MRRLLVLAMATALFMSVAAAAIAGQDLYEFAWPGKAAGSMASTDVAVDLDLTAKPTEMNWTKARGWGHYEDQHGNAFHLRVTHACVDEDSGAVTAWGIARVTAGSFDGGSLVPRDKAHAALSLRADGAGVVSAGLSIAATWEAAIPPHIVDYCQWPPLGDFPIEGQGFVDLAPE